VKPGDEFRIQERTMKKIKPWWGRLTVMESPVDEEQRDSGIIVPLKHEESAPFKRGVLLDIDDFWRTDGKQVADIIEVGTVVYYLNGILIGDVTIVDPGDILAYESE
jgi:co-chaperonin GroES (HSP10)